jgi:hypothetical protein
MENSTSTILNVQGSFTGNGLLGSHLFMKTRAYSELKQALKRLPDCSDL